MVDEGEVQPLRRRKPSPERAARYLRERDEFVRAAFRLFEMRDQSGVGVHEILREAGLSTRAFYRHFPSKDDLLLFMHRQSSDQVTQRLAAAVSGATTAAEALDAWVAEYLSVGYRPRRLARAKVLAKTGVAGAVGYDEVNAAEAAERREHVQAVLHWGLEDGSIPRAQPEQDAYAVHALVTSYLADRIFGGATFSFEEARAHTVELFLRRPPAPRTRPQRSASAGQPQA